MFEKTISFCAAKIGNIIKKPRANVWVFLIDLLLLFIAIVENNLLGNLLYQLDFLMLQNLNHKFRQWLS